MTVVRKIPLKHITYKYLTIVILFLLKVYEDSMQIRFIAGAIVTGVFFLVIFIVATVYFMRSKHQDELDKKSTNHLPLPMEYASNEGNYPKNVFIQCNLNIYIKELCI